MGKRVGDSLLKSNSFIQARDDDTGGDIDSRGVQEVKLTGPGKGQT